MEKKGKKKGKKKVEKKGKKKGEKKKPLQEGESGRRGAKGSVQPCSGCRPEKKL